jgi:23S rRNA pseudouridine1911/1915/1917 synthase
MHQIQQTPVGPIDIIYEDEHVLVINKPAGISMHKINPEDERTTVHDLFKAKLAGNDPLRGGIVHRLDKDTSGVVIMAKDISSLEFLQSQFSDRLVEKSYLALVWGKLPHPKARIELPIARSSKSPTAMVIRPGGKMSLSEYELVSEYHGFSLIRVRIHTGRTHQIRVQFAHMGHPVVGDNMYGSRPLPKGLSRQFLHAERLALTLPGQDSQSVFEAPLPNDLKTFLEGLND